MRSSKLNFLEIIFSHLLNRINSFEVDFSLIKFWIIFVSRQLNVDHMS
jgi:hypothetical protein